MAPLRGASATSLVTACTRRTIAPPQEIETAEVENASLRAAVTDARMRGSAGHSSRERLQREWDATIRGMMRQAASYDRQYDAALRSLDAVKPGVHSIFAKLGAGDAAVAESLAAAGVTDGNVMTHLGLIEQRVAELMQMYELAMAGERALLQW